MMGCFAPSICVRRGNGPASSLLPGRSERRRRRGGVVALACANRQTLAISGDVDLAVLADRRRIRRLIRDEILAAQFGTYVEKRLSKIIDFIGEKSVAAGLIGK